MDFVTQSSCAYNQVVSCNQVASRKSQFGVICPIPAGTIEGIATPMRLCERTGMDKPTNLIDFETIALAGTSRCTIRAPAAAAADRPQRVHAPERISVEDRCRSDSSATPSRSTPPPSTSRPPRCSTPGSSTASPTPTAAWPAIPAHRRAGREELDAERTANISALDRVMPRWSAEDVAAFAAYLRRFNTDIEELDGRAWRGRDRAGTKKPRNALVRGPSLVDVYEDSCRERLDLPDLAGLIVGLPVRRPRS